MLYLQIESWFCSNSTVQLQRDLVMLIEKNLELVRELLLSSLIF